MNLAKNFVNLIVFVQFALQFQCSRGQLLSFGKVKAKYVEDEDEPSEILSKRGTSMNRHLTASAIAASLALGTAAMGITTYSIRMHDWNKFKKAENGVVVGDGPKKDDKKNKNKHEKRAPPPAPIKIPPPSKDKNQPPSPGSPMILNNSSLTINNYYNQSPPKQKRSFISKSMLLRKRALKSKAPSGTSSTAKVLKSAREALKLNGNQFSRSSSKSGSSIFTASEQSSKSSSTSFSSLKSLLSRSTSAASTAAKNPTSSPEVLNTKSQSPLPSTSKGIGARHPDSHFLGYDMSKHDKYAPLAGRIEDYGKLSAGIGAFTAGAISLSTAVKQHDYDAKKFEKQKKEAKEGKKR